MRVDIIHFPLKAREAHFPLMGLAVSEQSAGMAGKIDGTDKCTTCFFGTSELCSLPRQEKCPTFRPSKTDALGLDMANAGNASL
jgi:hypothetical protein